jgi:hypothetical protein
LPAACASTLGDYYNGDSLSTEVFSMSGSDDMGKVTTPPEPSDVRYGMRGLLLTMTAVAAGTAVLGSTVRGASVESRTHIAANCGVCALVVLGCVGYYARLRFRLEQLAGHTILVLAPRGTLGIAARPWMTMLAGLFWVGLGLYFLAVMAIDATMPPGNRAPFIVSLFPCVISGALISMGIATMWWKRKVQFRDHGALWGVRLLRWTHVTDQRWDGASVILDGVDQRHRDMQLAAVVKAGKCSAVRRLLAQKISASDHRLQEITQDTSILPVRPLVPIGGGGQVSMSGMMSALTFYVLLVLVFAAFGPLGTASREFTRGAGIGMVGAIAMVAYGSRRVAGAGAPLVRLMTRFDWPSVIVAALTAFVCYLINQRLLFPHWTIGGVLGIGTGAGVSALAGMALRGKVDLCENGVMLIRWTFLPWVDVRLVKWNRDGNGSLVLRSGWRRVAAKVPREHREVVDRVLREKLAFGMSPQQDTGQ